jgi:hypothetical protein
MAWNELQISPQNEHKRFRYDLKRSADGELSYTDPQTGKQYLFRLIPYDAKLL